MSLYREELEADVDTEEFYDRLYGRSPFRDPEDYAEPCYAPVRSPHRASELTDENLPGALLPPGEIGSATARRAVPSPRGGAANTSEEAA